MKNLHVKWGEPLNIISSSRNVTFDRILSTKKREKKKVFKYDK